MTFFVAISFRRGEKEEDRKSKEGKVWLPGEMKRIQKESKAQESQLTYLSPTGCKRASGKQSNSKGKKSK